MNPDRAVEYSNDISHIRHCEERSNPCSVFSETWIATLHSISLAMTGVRKLILYVPLFFTSASRRLAIDDADQYGRNRVLRISRIFSFPSVISSSMNIRGKSGQEAYIRSHHIPVISGEARGTRVDEKSCSVFLTGSLVITTEIGDSVGMTGDWILPSSE